VSRPARDPGQDSAAGNRDREPHLAARAHRVIDPDGAISRGGADPGSLEPLEAAVLPGDARSGYGVKTGSLSHPRTVEVRVWTALSESTSQVGNRFSTSSSATRPSSLASAAPKQKWMP
jgi:hypothetical protein